MRMAVALVHTALLVGPLPTRSTARRPAVRLALEAGGDAPVPPPPARPQPATAEAMQAAIDALALRERRNVLLALGSSAAAASLYALQRANPADPVRLLRLMEAESPPLAVALKNGKPTVVEFYAPWCESCKLGARGLRKLERVYGGRVNFVTINGDDPCNQDAVRIFGVDSIPHFALFSGERVLRDTLIGAVPPSVLEKEIFKLIL